MNLEIHSQIDYIQARIVALENACHMQAHELSVSANIKNIAQDILLRERRILDNLVYAYFVAKVAFESSEAGNSVTKFYFPIVDKEEDLNSGLGRCGLGDTKKYQGVRRLITSRQPFRNGQEWIGHLRDYSNLGHRRLLPQTMKKQSVIDLGGAIRVNPANSEILFKNVMIGGKRISNLKINRGNVSGTIEKSLPISIKTEVSYLIEGTSVNVLWLCKKSIDEIIDISNQMSKL